VAEEGPRPGRRVRGSTTGRPLMAALDLFGRRWTLRIVWELREEHLGFRQLQARCDDMSSSVLRQRVRELLAARVLAQRPDGRYELTALGADVYHSLRPLIRWSKRWAAELAADPADPTEPCDGG
jgi:DNA-binding HxlR family transcriptional regulator